jgi:hypothetical protein
LFISRRKKSTIVIEPLSPEQPKKKRKLLKVDARTMLSLGDMQIDSAAYMVCGFIFDAKKDFLI